MKPPDWEELLKIAIGVMVATAFAVTMFMLIRTVGWADNLHGLSGMERAILAINGALMSMVVVVALSFLIWIIWSDTYGAGKDDRKSGDGADSAVHRRADGEGGGSPPPPSAG